MTRRARASTVDATGTRRRLEALAAIGHNARTVAELTGATPGSARALISSWRHPTRTRIHHTTADAVAYAYAELRHRPGTDTVTRVRAARAGFLHPDAWAGQDIDDPTTTPNELEATA